MIKQSTPVPVRWREEGWAFLESHHSDGFFMDWRREAFPKILMILGGKGNLELEHEQKVFLSSPALCVIPKGLKHRVVDQPGSPFSLYGLCLKKLRFPCEKLVDEACKEVHVDFDPQRLKPFNDLLRRLLWEDRSGEEIPVEDQVVLLYEILREVIKSGRSKDLQATTPAGQRVATYVQEMQQEFWKDETLDSLAKRLGLSRRHFTQLFRELTGESWNERLRRFRLEHARSLVLKTNLPARAIAFECGFKDLSHFYRSFQASYGQSPIACRRSMVPSRD